MVTFAAELFTIFIKVKGKNGLNAISETKSRLLCNTPIIKNLLEFASPFG